MEEDEVLDGEIIVDGEVESDIGTQTVEKQETEGEQETLQADETFAGNEELANEETENAAENAINTANLEFQRKLEAEYLAKEKNLLLTISNGAVNPYTQKPFENLEEYRIAVLQEQIKTAQKQVESGFISAEDAQKAIDISVNARLELEHLQRQKQEFEQRQVVEFGKQEFDSLKKYGITANSEADILALPNGNRVLGMWINGASLSDAYEVCNKHIVIDQKTKAAKQATLNAVNSKSHLTATTTSASSEMEVPKDTYTEYKKMFPKMSDKEIRDEYKKVHKSTR